MDNDEIPTVPPAPVAPANDPLNVVPTTIVPAGEGEVISMLSEQARLADEPETKALAVRSAGRLYWGKDSRMQLKPL